MTYNLRHGIRWNWSRGAKMVSSIGGMISTGETRPHRSPEPRPTASLPEDVVYAIC
jgi:hypothetical protein